MVGCFETEMATLCVVRHMEPMGGPMLNPYECPLMTRTNIIYFVSSNLVDRSVSVAHECDSRCAIQEEASATATVERRAVSIRKLLFCTTMICIVIIYFVCINVLQIYHLFKFETHAEAYMNRISVARHTVSYICTPPY